MCCSTDNIIATYTEVQEQATRVVEQSFDVDNFLDAINSVTKEIAVISYDINNLVETVRSHFTELSIEESKELLRISEPLSAIMEELHAKLLRSPLYVGMAKAVEQYMENVSEFQELCYDLKTFNIDLRLAPSFQQSLLQLSDHLRK